ncbi:MAG TPA: hypothetical protein VM165_17640 [Planctomycetaceae bacterium]|nr:hypothetical protein [Planctomycetaceae bacterium]
MRSDVDRAAFRRYYRGMTTLPINHSDLLVDRKNSTEQQLAGFIREILSRMNHSYDPKRDEHRFEATSPIIMTAELKSMIDGLIDSIADA